MFTIGSKISQQAMQTGASGASRIANAMSKGAKQNKAMVPATNGPQTMQKRSVWTQDVAFGLNNMKFYKSAAKLEASTEAALMRGSLDKDQPNSLTRNKPWVTFGFHSGEYMKTPLGEFEHGKLTPEDGDPPYTDTVRDVVAKSRENNGVVYASMEGWDAKQHFSELAMIAADKGQNYNEVVTELPINTMLTGDSASEDPFAMAAMLNYDSDDDTSSDDKPHDSETWGLSQKPSITTIEYAYLFEGEGRENIKHLAILDSSGQPVERATFMELYDDAAREVHKSTDGTLSAAALKKIDALQTYSKVGEPVKGVDLISEKLVENSPYFKAWAEQGTPSYKRNFNQAVAKLDTYFQDLKPREAVCFTLECPNAYGPVTHMMSGLLVKRSSGEPELHLAHHESVPIDPDMASPGWKAGVMTNMLGVPTNNHDTSDLFGGDKPRAIERTPLLNSLRNGGTPNITMFVSGNPMPIIDKLAVETREASEGTPAFYTPRDTDEGPANTCIAQTARLFTTPGADLRTVDGDKLDATTVTTTAVPEVIRQMHDAGLTNAGTLPLADMVVTPLGEDAVTFNNKETNPAQEKALKSGVGLAQFAMLGPKWGGGIVPAVKGNMSTPIDAKPDGPRQPHHAGVHDPDFKLAIGDLKPKDT